MLNGTFKIKQESPIVPNFLSAHPPFPRDYLLINPTYAKLSHTCHCIKPTMMFGSLFRLLLLVSLLLSTTTKTCASLSSLHLPSPQHFQRLLALGDFKEFNDLFANAVVNLPDVDVSRSGLNLRLRNMYCQNISVGDIQTNFTVTPPQQSNNTNGQASAIVMGFFVNPFDFLCVADYSYSFTFFRGSGKMTARARDSQANLKVNVTSPTSFAQKPPNETNVVSCDTRIEIYDMSFEGGVVARVLDLLEDLVDDVVENNVEDKICDEMDQIEGVLNGFLSKTFEQISPYLQTIPESLADPLAVERSLVVPDEVELLNLQDDPELSDLLARGLDAADKMLAEQVEDTAKPYVDGQTPSTDLGINVMLRKRFLEADGSFLLNMTELPDGVSFNRTLYEGHDRLTQSQIILDAVRIFGLDSLQTFNPLNLIGNFTIGNDLEWKYLNIEIDLTVQIKPSAREDALLLDPDPVEVKEQIQVSFGFNDVSVGASFLLAIDRQNLGDLELASVLDSKNLFSCFLSTLFDFQVSGLDFKVGSIDDPVLSGFVSPGIDRVVSTFVEATFIMYEPTFLRSLPHFFQDDVRRLIQEKAIKPALSDESVVECPLVIWPEGSIDFRDLLLQPEEASQLGGLGTEPYGDLVSQAYELLVDRLTEIGEDGLPKINEMLLRSWTLDQSGVEGDLSFPSPLFTFARNEISSDVFSNVVDRFEFRLSDVQVSNLDTISSPLELLKPSSRSSILTNAITIGNISNATSTEDLLTVSLRLFMSLEGSSSFDMQNEIDLFATVDKLSVNAALEALMDGPTLSKFPLRDILNVNCWLATLSAADVQKLVQGLSVDSFEAILNSLLMGAECLSCTSGGADILPELITLVNENGARESLSSSVPSLLTDIVESDWFQSIVDRSTENASLLCPHQPEYNKDAVTTDYGSLGFPALPGESLDTVLYSSILATWVAFMVFAENQRQQDVPPSDPLSAQVLFEPPQDAELVDWSDLGNSTGLGPTADTVMKQLRDFVGKRDENGLLGINSAVNNLLDESRTLSIEFDGALFERGGFVFAVDKLSLRGLDTFQSADVLNPIGPQTLQNTVALRSLVVEVELRVGFETDTETPRPLSLQIELEDLEAELALFAAFDMSRLRKLPLGALLQIDRVAPCLMSSMYNNFQVPQLSVTVGSFKTPVVKGLLNETSKSMKNVLEATVERFGNELTEAIPKLFEGAIKEIISAYIGSFASDSSCPEPMVSTSETAFVDFRDLLKPRDESLKLGGSGTSPYGDLFRVVLKYIEDEFLTVDPTTEESPVNDAIIRPLTEARSGVPGRISFNGDLFNSDTRVNAGGIDAQVALRAYDAYIEHLDTIGSPLSVLVPVNLQPNQLNNTASAGVGNPLRLGGRFAVELLSDGTTIKNNLEVNLSLDKLTVVLTALIKALESAFLGLPLEHLGNWRCWVAMLPAPKLDSRGVRVADNDPSISIVDLKMSVAQLGLNISCIDCTGPDMQLLTERLSQPEAIDEATRVANDLFGFASSLMEGEYIQVALDRLVSDSQRQCPSSPDYNPNAAQPIYEPFESPAREDSIAFLVAVLVAIISLGVGLALILLCVRLLVWRRHRKWLGSLSNDRIGILAADQHEEDEKLALINKSTRSLFLSRQIPLLVRFGTPIVILGNIAFFLSGHLSLGGSVTIILSLAGESYVADKFFEFSMASSAIEIWNAGGKELAMLILIFSGVWPYTKQLITLFLWFVPPSVVSVTRRENILLWLDALAKWSMIDVFVLVMTLAAFRVSIQSPDVAFLPEGFYSLDLLVVPKWGLYANMIAQLISQISSHFIIHYHRRAVEMATKSYEEKENRQTVFMAAPESSEDDSDPQPDDLTQAQVSEHDDAEVERLCDHAFTRPHRGETEKLVTRRSVRPILITLFFVLSVFIFVGCSVPSYSLDILGIVGILVESGQRFDAATSYYNVFQTAGLLFEQAAFTGQISDYIGLGSLSILMVTTVLIVPLAQSSVLMYLWFQPITRKRRHRLITVIECLSAWQYAEVFFLSVIVASW